MLQSLQVLPSRILAPSAPHICEVLKSLLLLPSSTTTSTTIAHTRLFTHIYATLQSLQLVSTGTSSHHLAHLHVLSCSLPPNNRNAIPSLPFPWPRYVGKPRNVSSRDCNTHNCHKIMPLRFCFCPIIPSKQLAQLKYIQPSESPWLSCQHPEPV